MRSRHRLGEGAGFEGSTWLMVDDLGAKNIYYC